jgi:hypothetical protein
MKNNFKFILITFFAITLHSCDSEDNSFDFANIGADVNFTDTKISVFDTDETLQLNLFTASGITIDKVEIFKEGTKISDAAIDGEMATFNSSTLGAFMFGENLDETTGSFDISAVATISNGQTSKSNYTIDVVNAIQFNDEIASVKYNDTISQKLSFKTFAQYATIDGVILEWKKGFDGAYAVDTNLNFNVESDTINLNNLAYKTTYNLVAGDTLYYKFTANSGSLSDSIETKIAIKAQKMGSSSSASLSADAANSEFNLATQKYAAGEIQFLASNGFEQVPETNIDFTKVNLTTGMTAEAYFSEGDLVKARTSYTNGSVSTSKTGVSKDDIFIYKVERLDEDNDTQIFYGLIKITDVILTNSNEETINFSFKEGQIIE